MPGWLQAAAPASRGRVTVSWRQVRRRLLAADNAVLAHPRCQTILSSADSYSVGLAQQLLHCARAAADCLHIGEIKRPLGSLEVKSAPTPATIRCSFNWGVQCCIKLSSSEPVGRAEFVRFRSSCV